MGPSFIWGRRRPRLSHIIRGKLGAIGGIIRRLEVELGVLK